MSTKVTLSVDTNALHGDKDNPLNHLDFSDDKGDTYDNLNDKTTFDTMLNSSDIVIWEAKESKSEAQLGISAITINSGTPAGFFAVSPALQSNGTWQATVGVNTTSENMVCEYTITFDDGIVGDAKVPIDPKLQIRKKETGN